MLEAIYEDTKQPCWVNMEFVVDAFPKGEYVIAYTFDPDRGGYRINREDFEEWREENE